MVILPEFGHLMSTIGSVVGPGSGVLFGAPASRIPGLPAFGTINHILSIHLDLEIYLQTLEKQCLKLSHYMRLAIRNSRFLMILSAIFGPIPFTFINSSLVAFCNCAIEVKPPL